MGAMSSKVMGPLPFGAMLHGAVGTPCRAMLKAVRTPSRASPPPFYHDAALWGPPPLTSSPRAAPPRAPLSMGSAPDGTAVVIGRGGGNKTYKAHEMAATCHAPGRPPPPPTPPSGTFWGGGQDFIPHPAPSHGRTERASGDRGLEWGGGGCGGKMRPPPVPEGVAVLRGRRCAAGAGGPAPVLTNPGAESRLRRGALRQRRLQTGEPRRGGRCCSHPRRGGD